MRWPGQIPAGKTTDAIVTTMDYLPTFAGLAWETLPADLNIDGKDILPLITGAVETSPHDYYYYYCYTHLQAIRDAHWKLVLPRKAKPKWMGWWARKIDAVQTIELYDLNSDMPEANNVAAQHPEVVQRLMKEIEAARAELGDYNCIGSGARFFEGGRKRPDIAKVNGKNGRKKKGKD
jgi:arylsulfatase A-like enzyme